jgi:hypothetical protein
MPIGPPWTGIRLDQLDARRLRALLKDVLETRKSEAKAR